MVCYVHNITLILIVLRKKVDFEETYFILSKESFLLSLFKHRHVIMRILAQTEYLLLSQEIDWIGWSGNTCDLYLESALFESTLRHLLSWLRFLVIFFSPSR
jgi:hypothetical protein